MFGATREEKAYIAPFAAFLIIMAGGELVAKLWEGRAFWMASSPRYWVYPLQTLVCGALLIRNWRHYELQPFRGTWFATAIGILVLAVWIAPQELFGAAHRVEGFEPHFFGESGWPYALNVGMRFIRLAIVVPLLEEIFWRGYLLRFVISQDFRSVPFGTFTWGSFAIVSVGFCLEHGFSDWPAAILAGMLYNWVAYRTRSLSACVLAHAVTNLLLGFYILQTRQWGFW